MKSITHLAAGLVLSPALFVGVASLRDESLALSAAISFVVGSKAPDWLEIRTWIMGRRLSLIPHRTITHTWWLWVLIMLCSPLLLSGSPLALWLTLGFALGCLLHIGMDALTPMGVPVLNPFGTRRRINLGPLSKDWGFLPALCLTQVVVWLLGPALVP